MQTGPQRGGVRPLAALVTAGVALVTGCNPPGLEAKVAPGATRLSYPVPAGYRVSSPRAGDRAGRRIILVHGTPGAADGWLDYLTDVPPGSEYVAVDRPGFGESGPDGAIVSLREQAAALVPLLVERDGRWPVLVGHSLGAPIVARLAVDQPSKVGALVLLAGSLDPAQERIHWAQPVGEWPGIRSMLPRALRNANRELMALKPELEALEPRLAAIRCPIEIVHGRKDGLVPYANVPFMQTRFTSAPLNVVTLPEADHFIVWNQVATVRAAIAGAAEAGVGRC
jgi:pimeloyl-ACP methyl ester carboxylesterase